MEMSSERPALAAVGHFHAAGQAYGRHQDISSLEGLLVALSLLGGPCSYLIGTTGSRDV